MRSRQLEVRSGIAIIKQEKPTRWITVQGKHIPITPPRVTTPSSGRGAVSKPELINLGDLVQLYRLHGELADLEAKKSQGKRLSDSDYVRYSRALPKREQLVDKLGQQFYALGKRELESAGVSDVGMASRRTEYGRAYINRFMEQWDSAADVESKIIALDTIINSIHGRGAMVPIFVDASTEEVEETLDELAAGPKRGSELAWQQRYRPPEAERERKPWPLQRLEVQSGRTILKRC